MLDEFWIMKLFEESEEFLTSRYLVDGLNSAWRILIQHNSNVDYGWYSIKVYVLTNSIGAEVKEVSAIDSLSF